MNLMMVRKCVFEPRKIPEIKSKSMRTKDFSKIGYKEIMDSSEIYVGYVHMK